MTFLEAYAIGMGVVLLLRVSGVTLPEKRLKNTKPGCEDYVEHTSPLIPWYPRERESH